MIRKITAYRQFDNHPCVSIEVVCDDCQQISQNSKGSYGEFYGSHHAKQNSRKDGFSEFRRSLGTNAQLIDLCPSCQPPLRKVRISA